ncbi:MAG: hypothetical protein A2087_07015 [Spirochaetes bacterium GWD1_61_31]|nr:MAG: hypothetical protein A2Y37_08455 [Spirochaetes bacterium GWB1_60_80]OHD28480.1 MAG: hypothetical protein A2004_14800 [Spirochaetes bacterium GWC1_61_12]OHD40096.1 MAG: hypothetical protein A2087_07015 [Spirochaetes bacterium GWD1_61_31]OHD45856.1 MAG: hypothetical protein A2Y35_04090 [Spirochaetes bacterium GWE1_60_18]OHD58399.1 MAG: hypothetical protein A2Y32_06480 [Spirochaetes bacterium GWF1_60_12]HAW85379.1 hypothetical protein [Spirochaetaceae bacterium]
MDRTSQVFGNPMPAAVVREAKKKKRGYAAKYGDDSQAVYHVRAFDNPVLGPEFGLQNLELREGGQPIDAQRGVLVGNIRMGFGHYRIAMAIASAVRQRGYIPYWFDMNSFAQTTGGRVVARLNELYSFGSRLSQRNALFNSLYWEPLNYEGFKKLSFNAVDQRVAELHAPLCAQLPRDMPFIATHVWPAQAALHAGLPNVINMIPDNWPMGLHLAEGALHTVQSPSAALGYRLLREMAGKNKLSQPMPANSIHCVGHYIDHELASNIEADCRARLERFRNKQPRRLLISVGGAGAQFEIIGELLRRYQSRLADGSLAVYLNVGDHAAVWERLAAAVPGLAGLATRHFNDWPETRLFCTAAHGQPVGGLHVFLNADKYAAVYATNLLMRSCDVLITKPSELAFYPVPKLFIKRVGGHERWGAIRSAELGDGTYEMESLESAAQVLDLMINEDDILSLQCECILNAHKAGVYSGAYRIVDLSLQAAGRA